MRHSTKRVLRLMTLCWLLAFGVCATTYAAAPGLNLPSVEAFIYKWQRSGGSELGSSQSFITDLCKLIDVPAPDAPRPELADNSYVFEKAVARVSASGKASTARIDLYKKGCFIWESKQGSARPTPDEPGPRRSGHAERGTPAWEKVLLNARIQAADYARDLPPGENAPPFILVADVGYTIDIYADFHASGEYTPFPSARENRFTLQDFRKPEVRAMFRSIWTDPLSLDPSREAEKVTRALALKLADLSASLERSGHAPDTASLFIQRCLSLMFAEDCGLLPHNGFTSLLADLEKTPERFAPTVTQLWATMRTGGVPDSLGVRVLRFHGALYENAQALPLDAAQIGILLEAARAHWAAVDTAIFGTLLERALSPQERHALGAHYTPTAYVERLVIPTVIEPIRAEWEDVKDAALTCVMAGDQEGAVAAVTAFHKRLTELVVLDPSCGSGNFLAVTMNLVKDVEGEVVQALRSLGQSELDFQKRGYSVRPHQFRGIEVVQRAADISELVLWLTALQQHYAIHGNVPPPVALLQPVIHIECRDAVLAWNADGTARKADPWPQADYIVGNPPYIGNKLMRQALGDGYVEALRSAYPELPESIDYVMYWWHRSAALAKTGAVQRFGLITTNKIRQTFNRRVVEKYVNAQPGLNILFAIPDHPWYDARQGGAQVRIAMTVCGMELRQGILAESILERREDEYIKVNLDTLRGKINTGLTIDVDATKLLSLKANAKLSWRGVTVVGQGFIITPEHAKLLGLGRIPGLEKHIRPYMNGNDLAKTSRNKMIIDLYGLTIQEIQRRYPEVYAWIVDNVKPQRDAVRRQARRENWWIFAEPAPNMREALSNIPRFIATPQTSRRFYFSFVDVNVIPDDKLVVFSSDDAYFLGILSSKAHKAWTIATGGRLGVGNDPVYNKSACFDAFPFPAAFEEQKARIRELAEQLDAHRKARQTLHPKLTLTDMYAVLEQVRNGVHLNSKEQRISEQADIATLKGLHDALDAAVIDAYGWPGNLSADKILSRLVALNQERAAEEQRSLVRWLRPDFQTKLRP